MECGMPNAECGTSGMTNVECGMWNGGILGMTNVD